MNIKLKNAILAFKYINKQDISYNEGKYIKYTSGELVDGANYKYTDEIEIDSTKDYYLASYYNYAATPNAFYDENHSFIAEGSQFYPASATKVTSAQIVPLTKIIIPLGAKYVRFATGSSTSPSGATWQCFSVNKGVVVEGAVVPES